MHEPSPAYMTVAPLTSGSVADCAALWPDRNAYTNQEFAAALRSCAQLFDERRAIGARVHENERLSAFGLSVFLQPDFADAYLAAPHPLLGKRLLLDPRPIAGFADIAAANANRGLCLCVLAANFDVTSPNAAAALGLCMQATLDMHRGYRIERFINEAVGDANIEFLATSGAFDFVRTFETAAPGTALRSALFTLTKERAAERKSTLLPLFVYNPPRVGFTPAEQDLLRAALDAAPDDVISARLGIPLSATKARWTRIHQRVAARLPEIRNAVPRPQDMTRRGPQLRHLVLAYVRDNPSELTPCAKAHRAK